MKYSILASIVFVLSMSNCFGNEKTLARLTMDYPHGETRIQISSNDTYLLYGAIPKYKKIRPGVFELQQVYELLKPHLQKNLPSNERPYPDATYGMVVILYSDSTQENFLIYNLEELTSTIFEMAAKHVIEESPESEQPFLV